MNPANVLRSIIGGDNNRTSKSPRESTSSPAVPKSQRNATKSSQSLSFSPFAPHYSCISATSNQRDSGVTILLGPSCEIVNNPTRSDGGRKLELSIKYQQSTVLNILAIYASGSKTQREDWYNQLLSEELSLLQIDIFAGDFNCILDPADTDSPYDSPAS